MASDFIGCQRVMIADPHPIIIDSVTAALTPQDAFRVVHAATTIRQICPNVTHHNVDLLLCAYEFLPDSLPDGLALMARLRRTHPALKIVILANFLPGSPLVKHVRSTGANALLHKSELYADLLVASLQRVIDGQFVYSDDSLRSHDLGVSDPDLLHARAQTLSPNELEVLRYYLHGYDDQMIAFRRKRSTKTVHNQRMQALHKLRLKDAPSKVIVETLSGLRSWLT